VRLLRNYKKYVGKQHKNDVDYQFDKTRFLADHASLRSFCSELFNTQLFEIFTRDAIGALNGESTDRAQEIQLFDELIIDKENRTKAGRIYNRQRAKPTPLLTSLAGNVQDTVYVAEASLHPGMEWTSNDASSSSGKRSYSYELFPALDVRLLRPTEPAKRLVPVPRTQVHFLQGELAKIKSEPDNRTSSLGARLSRTGQTRHFKMPRRLSSRSESASTSETPFSGSTSSTPRKDNNRLCEEGGLSPVEDDGGLGEFNVAKDRDEYTAGDLSLFCSSPETGSDRSLLGSRLGNKRPSN